MKPTAVNRSLKTPPRVRAQTLRMSRRNRIGQGGFSVVFRNFDASGKAFAVKVSKQSDAGLRKWGDTFIVREAKALQKLAHPNIPAFYALGEYRPKSPSGKEWPFLAMEFLAGQDVCSQARFRRLVAPLELYEVIDMLKQATLTLAYIHDQGWVHADVKTENLYLSKGRIMLTDFASAREEEKTIPPEDLTWAMGTLEFMSLNRLKNLPPTKADDIYALGISLCELFIGPAAIDRYKAIGYNFKASEQKISAEQAFRLAQDRLRTLINKSKQPRLVKELMRKMTWHTRRRSFSDCHEVNAFIDRIYREIFGIKLSPN